MKSLARFAVTVVLISAAVGCSSKTATRIAEVETRVGEVQRSSQERIDIQGRQVAILDQRLEELSTRLSALDRQLTAQEASIQQVSEYLERYDSTWNTFSRLQTEYDNELKQLRDQQVAATNNLTEARQELETSLRGVSTEILSVRNDLRQRIDRTNDDVFRLREQSKEKLDDMTAALNRFGEAVQAILTLQRAQFQNMTEAYARSLADVEPFLPEAMLSNINTPELLVSPNPDVESPSQQDVE